MVTKRWMALAAPPSMVFASVLLLAGCDEGRVFEPPGEHISVTLSGVLLDGRDLEGRPLSGSVAVFRSDKSTPVLVDGDHIIEIGDDGAFDVSFEAFTTDSILELVATAPAPFLPAAKAVRVGGGPISLEIHLSSTLITGHVQGPAGQPAQVDIWIMRDNGTGDFEPYEIAGGRDFIEPVPPSGVNFGWDTDPLGDFAIPVRVPDAEFRLVFVVDRNTDKFDSFLADLFVDSGAPNRLPDITLEPALQ